MASSVIEWLLSVSASRTRPTSLEWSMLKPSCRNRPLSTGSSRSKAFSIEVCELRNRQRKMLAIRKIRARTNRSTEKTRRMSRLRISRPRSTTGAAAAGPLALGGPGTNVPQRRHCHSSREPFSAASCARRSGSSGA